jgi:hypothetical protein
VSAVLFIVILSALAAGGAGILVKWLLEFKESDARISWREFAIGMACTPLLAALTAYIGWVIARHNNVTFSEYLNGWEIAAVKHVTECHRDGACLWEYDCDPYIVMVPYSCNCNDKGVCSTCYRPETRYHSCPYVDREYSYSVQTTLGNYPVAKGVFPENPQAHRWRRSEAIPQSVIYRAGVGDPIFWTTAKQRCDADSPGPVTKKHNYPNYILASEHTIMKQYSGDIEEYRKNNLLPELPKEVRALYWADKAKFVGFKPPDAMIWQKSLEYLNAALGSQLNGDLMLVVVKSSAVSANPERYSLALKAFWQDKKTHQIYALPKNAIVVILGTEDGSVVSWSRAFTAMPIGNEKLTVMLRDGLRGLPLAPEHIIGLVGSHRDEKGVHYPPDGNATVLCRLLWGLDDPSTRFSRISMSGKDSRGGFLYLKGEIRLTTNQTIVIILCAFLVCLSVWLWAAIHFDPSENRSCFRRS